MPEGINKPTERVIQKYVEQAASRKVNLEKTRNDEYARIYNNLAPEVYEEFKVGTTDDGGKWMCSPYNFENDIQKLTNQRCRIVGVDMNDQSDDTKKKLTSIRANSTKARISVTTNETVGEYSINDLMAMHNVKEIEILKIDIEGSELTVMPEFLKTQLPAQILIEVHGKPEETLNFLKMVASHGYLLFHYEINGAWHNLCEYAFIHQSAIERYEATLLARFLN